MTEGAHKLPKGSTSGDEPGSQIANAPASNPSASRLRPVRWSRSEYAGLTMHLGCSVKLKTIWEEGERGIVFRCLDHHADLTVAVMDC